MGGGGGVGERAGWMTQQRPTSHFRDNILFLNMLLTDVDQFRRQRITHASAF